MYLNKLLLKEFGQFHNKEIDLKQGVNLIYGEQGAGKTTVKDFISGILYGIEGTEERNPRGRKEFSGKAYMKKEGKSYLIERSFLRTFGKVSVLDVQSGRELRLSDPDTLQGTILELDSHTYDDAMCIETPERADKEGLENAVRDCLVNLSETGTTDINKEKAISYLKAEKRKNDTRPMIRRLNELTDRIEAYDEVDNEIAAVESEMAKLDEEFAIEAAKRKRVARKLVENEDGSISYEVDPNLDEKLNKLMETGHGMLREEEDPVPVKLTDKLPVIFATGILVILVIAAIVYIMPFENAIRKLFIIFTAIFVIFTIIDGLRVKGYFAADDISTPSEEDFQKVLAEIEEENEEREAIEFDMTFAREYAEKKAALKAQESKLLEDRTERNRLRAEFNSVFKKKSALEEEIRSINLAIASINRLSAELKDSLFAAADRHITEMITGMTDGRYQGIRLDENKRVILKAGDDYVGMESLSEPLSKQIYLAVRLGIARLLYRDNVPLIIDDVFAGFHEKELVNMMACLETFEAEQILLLTSDRQVRTVLEGQNESFHYLEL